MTEKDFKEEKQENSSKKNWFADVSDKKEDTITASGYASDEKYENPSAEGADGFCDKKNTSKHETLLSPETDNIEKTDEEWDSEEVNSQVDREKEYTVSTTNFYEQYGGEINTYVETAGDIDREEIYAEEEKKSESWIHTPKKRRKKHHARNFLILVILLLGGYFFATSSYFNIKEIAVTGNNTVSEEDVIKKSGVKKGYNIFKIREKDVKKNLTKDPYIAEVTLDRTFPGKLTIVLRERRGFASILYDKKYWLVDEDLTVIKALKEPPKTTLISGLKVKNAVSGKPIVTDNNEKTDMAFKLLTAMKKEDIFFKKIDVSDEVVKIYIYDNLVCKGDGADLLKQIKNTNLKKILYNLYKRKIKKGSIIISNDEYCSYNPKVE